MVQADWPIKALSMHIQKPLRITKGNDSQRIGPSPYIFAISIRSVNMNVHARFDETLSMTLQVM